MPMTEDELDDLLPDYCEIKPYLCDLCQNEHPEWEEEIKQAMVTDDPGRMERLWKLQGVPCLVFEYNDCAAAICKNHLRKILEAMDSG